MGKKKKKVWQGWNSQTRTPSAGAIQGTSTTGKGKGGAKGRWYGSGRTATVRAPIMPSTKEHVEWNPGITPEIFAHFVTLQLQLGPTKEVAGFAYYDKELDLINWAYSNAAELNASHALVQSNTAPAIVASLTDLGKKFNVYVHSHADFGGSWSHTDETAQRNTVLPAMEQEEKGVRYFLLFSQYTWHARMIYWEDHGKVAKHRDGYVKLGGEKLEFTRHYRQPKVVTRATHVVQPKRDYTQHGYSNRPAKQPAATTPSTTPGAVFPQDGRPNPKPLWQQNREAWQQQRLKAQEDKVEKGRKKRRQECVNILGEAEVLAMEMAGMPPDEIRETAQWVADHADDPDWMDKRGTLVDGGASAIELEAAGDDGYQPPLKGRSI